MLYGTIKYDEIWMINSKTTNRLTNSSTKFSSYIPHQKNEKKGKVIDGIVKPQLLLMEMDV